MMLTMLAGWEHVMGDNTLSVKDVLLPQGGTVTVEIGMDNTDDITALQFDLSLPAGLTVAKNERGRLLYAKTARCEEHSLTIQENETGEYRVLLYSVDNYLIDGTSGPFMTFTLQADPSLGVGTSHDVNLSGIILTRVDQTKFAPADMTVHVTIAEATDLRTVLDETSTTAPEAASGVDVRVRRTIAAGEWNTICLPFAMTEAQTKEAFGNDVQLADFTGYDVTENADAEIAGITVHFQGVTAIEANHPYIIKVAAPVTEFTVDGVDITPEEEPTNATIKRTRKAWSEMTGTYTAGFTVPEQTLFLSGGKFWYSTGQTKMKAFRAYFDFYDVLAEVENASVKMVVNFGDETGLSSVSFSIENDQSSMYDIQGRKVQGQNAQKGIYIINGKKILK